MGRWTNENSGMNVVRAIAKDVIKNESKKKRIWSEAYAAWGYYMQDDVSDEDDYLIWCSIDVGDRIDMNSFGFSPPGEFGTVISLRRETPDDVPVWFMKILRPDGKIVELRMKEQEIFKIGWRAISKF